MQIAFRRRPRQLSPPSPFPQHKHTLDGWCRLRTYGVDTQRAGSTGCERHAGPAAPQGCSRCELFRPPVGPALDPAALTRSPPRRTLTTQARPSAKRPADTAVPLFCPRDARALVRAFTAPQPQWDGGVRRPPVGSARTDCWRPRPRCRCTLTASSVPPRCPSKNAWSRRSRSTRWRLCRPGISK